MTREEWKARSKRSISVEEQLARMLAARFALVDVQCIDCKAIVKAVKHRKRCDDCREGPIRARHQRKSAVRRGAQVAGPETTIAELAADCGGICWLCGLIVNLNLPYPHPMMASFDHVMPISRGGTDARENLRLAHLDCNVKRGNKMCMNEVTA